MKEKYNDAKEQALKDIAEEQKAIKPDEKTCIKCKKQLHHSEFRKRHNKCKKCSCEYKKNTKCQFEDCVEPIDTNSYKYCSLHRILLKY